jgi:phage terminase large subunit
MPEELFRQEFMCDFSAANVGAILGRWVEQAEKSGRVSDGVEYDPAGADIEISSDIGFRDTATWWFWQSMLGGYQIVDHDSGWGIDAEEWCYRLRDKLKPYKLGRIWLPHDARAKTFAAKRSAVETFIEFFGAEHVAITPNVSKADRINAARVLLPRCKFNATRCEKGLEALRAWSFEWDEDRKTFSSEPLHDWASHDGDGFSYGCVVARLADPPKPAPEPMRGITVGKTGIQAPTLDELWRETRKRTERI